MSKEYEFLIYDKPEDGIAIVTLNRPESLNALSLELVNEIIDAADTAADDPEVAVIIYRGAGRAFCSGRDFKASAELQTKDPEGWFAWRNRFRGLGPETWLHPKATIAQVHGYAVGGGHNFALTCDITICSDDAKIGLPEARMGSLSGDRVIWNWLMGPKKTKEYIFTGRMMTATEACEFGVVNQVVPKEDLENTVMMLARDIAAMERANPGYIRGNKFLINQRHPDMMMYSTINPEVIASSAFLTDARMRSKEHQESFYTRVADKGFHDAVDNMHSGYSASPRE